jgi:hypothetical protein
MNLRGDNPLLVQAGLGASMSLKSLLDLILGADHLTRGLGDAEARLLVEWLVERTEAVHAQKGEHAARRELDRMCRRARAIARFVGLWCYEHDHGAACQLAATERFPWPLPTQPMDAWELLRDILAWEEDRHTAGVREAA